MTHPVHSKNTCKSKTVDLKEAVSAMIVSELLAKTVPQYKIEQVADETVESLKSLILRDINLTSRAPTERRKAMVAMNEIFDEFKEELIQLIEAKLLAYTSVM